MRKYADSCNPERLHTLQKIFDLIWIELRANGSSNYTGPMNPDALREEIARRVLGRYDAHDFKADEIVQTVLTTVGIGSRGLWNGKEGKRNDAPRP